jgi:acylphosphatase
MQAHVVVRGRVQGVGFRWFVRETAERIGVAGWVRNRPDGSVEVAADGDDAAIQLLRSALARGPSGASVTSIDDLPPHGTPLVRPFSILR